MKTENQINSDLKGAIKGGEKEVRDVLRMLVSSLKNRSLSEKRDLNDDEVIAIVKKNIKSRKDSIEQFTKGGRLDLAEKEDVEIKILQKYVPEQLGEADIRKIVLEIVNGQEGSDLNFGLVMKQVMQKVGSDAEGSIVSKVVKEILA